MLAGNAVLDGILNTVLALNGLIYKNRTFRLMAGQYPYDVQVVRLPWGELKQSPIDIIKAYTGNTILEFRDEDDELKASVFLPEADKDNPLKRSLVCKSIDNRLEEVW